jgi:hypothetical protein
MTINNSISDPIVQISVWAKQKPDVSRRSAAWAEV